ncbi:hypothetical protein Tco_1480177 [Tanacetum coccineum]
MLRVTLTAQMVIMHVLLTLRNDHIAAILSYGDLQLGNILITRVYFVEGLGSKDEAPEEMKTFLKKITVLLQALVIIAKAIATACYTQNRSIIHCRFNKTPYELINGRKPDISSLHVFGALCYPQNDREDIGNLGAKAMAFEQRSSKPGLQGMNSGQISSRLGLTYAPLTITSQKTTECELDLLVEAIYSKHFTDVDELQQQHVQQQDDPAPLQPEAVADNVPNAMFDGNTFVNPFAPPSISLAESSSQHVEHAYILSTIPS